MTCVVDVGEIGVVGESGVMGEKEGETEEEKVAENDDATEEAKEIELAEPYELDSEPIELDTQWYELALHERVAFELTEEFSEGVDTDVQQLAKVSEESNSVSYFSTWNVSLTVFKVGNDL